MEKIRNIAIIAHVDHGKTTLVDQLLRQSGTFRSNQAVVERVMDSMDLEREKGITIKAKNAAFQYHDYHINIVDTPGHADFGGEVERILKMIDGVLLVVDAFDGPQAQTKFVLRKALEIGAKPIIVINKIDRENARPHKVLDMIFELFLELHATDEQLDFTAIYAERQARLRGQGMEGSSGRRDPQRRHGRALRRHHREDSAARGERGQAFRNARFESRLQRLHRPNCLRERSPAARSRSATKSFAFTRTAHAKKAGVTKVLSHAGLAKIEIDGSLAGNIVGIAGIEDVFIGETLTDSETAEAVPFVDIDPPTIKMQFVVNDSPLAGREGKFLTARHIRDRLVRETRTNVSIILADTDTAGVFEISARGEMQIAILVEQMRREGFEVMVSRPEVIFHKDEAGNVLEPIETLYVETPADKLGDILQNLANRKGEITNMNHHQTTVSVEAVIPTRGLIGFETDLVNLDARRRHHEPSLQGVRPEARRNHHAPQRRARLHGNRRRHRLRHQQYPGTRPPLSSAPAKRSTPAWSSAKIHAQTTWR